MIAGVLRCERDTRAETGRRTCLASGVCETALTLTAVTGKNLLPVIRHYYGFNYLILFYTRAHTHTHGEAKIALACYEPINWERFLKIYIRDAIRNSYKTYEICLMISQSTVNWRNLHPGGRILKDFFITLQVLMRFGLQFSRHFVCFRNVGTIDIVFHVANLLERIRLWVL